MDGSWKILVVDDREDNLFAMESVLRPVGRPIVCARSGDEALKTVLRGGIAVILLDVLMPRMDGLEVVEYLKRLDHTRSLPVILVTGIGRDDDLAARAYHLGVADFLVKPVEPWAVRSKVRVLADLYVENQLLRRRLDTLGAPAPPLPTVPPQHRPPWRAVRLRGDGIKGVTDDRC
ncbi:MULTISPECIES: response regulator [unclassified Streptomyces]|uniref:response regulator n=1 Tax=unclassified Streptomyces TaxID=2593676 RepID=UPI0033C9A198